MDLDERASLGWQVFEETNDAVFMMTEDNVVCEVNPFAQRLTGLARSELIGRSLFDLISSNSKQIEAAVGALSQTGIFHSREQFQLHSRRSGLLPVNISISRIHTPSGTFGVVIARDISDRVAAEQELRQSRDLLEQRVSERTSELIETNRQLLAANQQLQAAQDQAIKQEQLRIAGQIASGMAHDINNSVTPILSLTEVLAADQSLTSEQLEHIRHIRLGATDIAATVRRLRELRPVPSDAKHQKLTLPQLLESVVSLTRPQWDNDAKRQGKSIDLQVTQLMPATVLADESALRSVFANLIFNSIDAIPESGLIEVSCSTFQDSVAVEIVDNGEGMTEDQLHRCFEPFLTTREHGCGLGLSLSRRIVEQHGGRLEIASVQGKGTTVVVSLPLAEEDETQSSEADELQSQPMRILLVDDNELVRSSFQTLLQLKGMQVKVAADEPDALQLIDESEFDVVISDLFLGDTDGSQLLRTCRKLQPAIRTVLMTGWVNAVDPVKQDAADITMQKPLVVDDLLNLLAEFRTV